MKHLAPVLLLAGLLAAGGWWLREAPRAPAAPAPALAARAAAPAAGRTAAHLVTPAADPAPLPALLAGYLRDGTPAERDHALAHLLPRLVALDPPAASRLARDWEPGPLRTELFTRLARTWADADLAGAFAWLAALAGDPDGAHAARELIAEIGRSDPAGALELAVATQALPDDGSLEHLAQLWAEEKPGEAAAWIARQPAGEWRDRLAARIARVRAQQEQARAAGTGVARG